MKRLSLFLQGLLLLIAGLWLTPQTASADLPFRNHRYDAFRVLKVNEQNIVFVGNSITNMHEWWEALGSDHRVLNRGVSGALSDECLNNIEAVISGHPAKIFLMIGTNDLGTYIGNTTIPFENFKKIVQTVRRESPQTKLYVESVLPVSATNARTPASIRQLNSLMRDYVADIENVEYCDIYSRLTAAGSTAINGDYTLDGLHLNAAGYQVWLDVIREQVGLEQVYEAGATMKYFSNTASTGMRTSYFASYPVASTDVLFFGDEMVHGGEWHELLNCAHVKNRGTGWGYPGASMTEISRNIEATFTGRSGNQKPARVILYAGASELNGGTAAATVYATYQGLITKIRNYAPAAQILLLSVIPQNNATRNTGTITTFNNSLKTYAAANGNVEYIDVFTTLLGTGNLPNAKYMNGNYLYGLGYVKVAQALAPYLAAEGAVALTDAEAEEQVERLTARANLMTAINKANDLKEGDGVGQYPASALQSVHTAQAAAEQMLANSAASIAQMQDATTQLQQATSAALPFLNLPKASTSQEEYFYNLSSLRDGRFVQAETATAGLVSVEDKSSATTWWKFVQRSEGTYNIVNRSTGAYISPTASYNTQLQMVAAEPAKGWTISYGNTPASYIISSGKVQMNQTSIEHKIYNWSTGESGQDRGDQGCQFFIYDVQKADASAVLAEAAEALSHFGPGYPESNSTARISLHAAIDAAGDGTDDVAVAALQAAVYAYKSNYTELRGYVDGEQYAFINEQYGGDRWLLYNNNGTLALTNTIPDELPATAVFTAQRQSNGKFAFLNNEGQYLCFVGNPGANTASWSGYTNGFSATYSTQRNDFYFLPHNANNPATNTAVASGVTNADLFGLCMLVGYRNNGNPSGMAVSNTDGTFSQAGEALFFNGTYSNLWSVVVVSGETEPAPPTVIPVTVIDDAKAALAFKGPGYPGENSAVRTQLKAAVKAAGTGTSNTLNAEVLVALDNYKNATERLQGFVDGERYVFINEQYGGQRWMLYADADAGLKLTQTIPATYPDNAVFTAVQKSDGKFAFKTSDEQYLVYVGAPGRTDATWEGYETGVASEYASPMCDFTFLAHNVDHAFSVAQGITNADLFGTFLLVGTRSSGVSPASALIVENATGVFDQANTALFFNGAYSNLWKAEVLRDAPDVVVPNPKADYATNYDDQNTTNTARSTSAVTLTSPSKGQQTIQVNQSSTKKLVYDLTDLDNCFVCEASEEVQPGITFAGEWMNYYVYVDEGADGFDARVDEARYVPAEGSDLKSFSFYSFSTSDDASGWNSKGQTLTGSARNKAPLPAFSAPAEPGVYRMRYKVDWNDIDPRGNNVTRFGTNMKAGGGVIVDVFLNVGDVDITRVEQVKDFSPAPAHPVIYDLQGRRVSVARHGLYIVNGKKMLRR